MHAAATRNAVMVVDAAILKDAIRHVEVTRLHRDAAAGQDASNQGEPLDVVTTASQGTRRLAV